LNLSLIATSADSVANNIVMLKEGIVKVSVCC
jgi:hypothetical protein